MIFSTAFRSIRCISENKRDQKLNDLMFEMKSLRNATIHVDRSFNAQLAAELIKGVKTIVEMLRISC